MPRLRDMAKVLRSKNAGPFMITFDMLFRNREDMDKVVKAGVLTVDRLSNLLKCAQNEITVHVYPPANAIKITIPRRHSSGAFDDSDVFGCQQHAGLLDVEVPAR